MSIATLKKKTATKYRNMSVSQPQFSINGTLRNQGYIGQDSLSRSLIRTPMLGNAPKGYGGLNGAYKTAPVIVEASLFTTNDPTYVKTSVGNTSGDIAVQNKFLNCRELPCSHPTVKNLSNTAEDYIREVKNKTLNCIDNTDTVGLYGPNLVKNGKFDAQTAPVAGGAPTNWTVLNGGGGMGIISVASPSFLNPSNLPTTEFTQFVYFYNLNNFQSIGQNVTFSPGNYVISFWTSLNNTISSLSQTINVKIDAIVNSTFGYTNTQWKKITIPFTVMNAGVLQLSFSSNYLSTPGNPVDTTNFIGGVSIYSTDPPCNTKICNSTEYSTLFKTKSKFSKIKSKSNFTKVITNDNGTVKYSGSYADYLERVKKACNQKTPLKVDTNRGPIY